MLPKNELKIICELTNWYLRAIGTYGLWRKFGFKYFGGWMREKIMSRGKSHSSQDFRCFVYLRECDNLIKEREEKKEVA